jgi:hypothetical protein
MFNLKKQLLMSKLILFATGMKSISFLSGMLLLIVGATFIKCACTNDDCASTPHVYLEVIDTAGKNLFAEPDPMLLIDSVKVTGVYTNFIDNINSWLTEREGKPIIAFSPGGAPREYIRGDPKKYVISYSATESDTVLLENLVYTSGECCGRVLTNFDVKLNDVPYCTACAYQIISIVR